MRVFTFTLLFIIKLFSHTLYTHNNMLSWLQCCSLFLWFRCVVTQGFALFPWPSRLWVMRVCINILSAYSLLHNHIQYFFIFPGSAIAHARLPCVLMCSGIVIAVPPPHGFPSVCVGTSCACAPENSPALFTTQCVFYNRLLNNADNSNCHPVQPMPPLHHPPPLGIH